MKRNFKTKILTIVLVTTLLSVGFLGYYFGVRAGYVADETEPWLTQPLQEASYIVGQFNSSHYYARNHTGYGTSINKGYEMLSSNASQILNWVIGNVSDGDSLSVTSGTFEIDSPIIINNKDITMEGEGDEATILKLTDDVNCIELSGGAVVHLEKFQVDCDRKNGHGIYGSSTATSSIKYSSLEHIQISKINYTNNYWGIYIKNPAYSYFADILIGGGNGMKWENTYGSNRGNSHINRLHVTWGNSDIDDVTGLELRSVDGQLNLNCIVGLDIWGLGTTATNRTGIRFNKARYNWVSQFTIEHCTANVIILENVSSFNQFSQGWCDAFDYFINVTDGSHSNDFTDISCSGQSAVTRLIYELGSITGSRGGNTYTNVRGNNEGSYDFHATPIVKYTQSKLYGQTGLCGDSLKVSENSGTQVCADNEDIGHGLVMTPASVQVSSMNDTYDGVPVIVTVDWSNVDATNIKVGIYWVNGTAIGDDVILVSWLTKVNP